MSIIEKKRELTAGEIGLLTDLLEQAGYGEVLDVIGTLAAADADGANERVTIGETERESLGALSSILWDLAQGCNDPDPTIDDEFTAFVAEADKLIGPHK